MTETVLDDHVDFETVSSAEPASLFPGDTGEFDIHLRGAIIRILRGPLLDGESHKPEWAALIKHERTVKKFFSELFLTVLIDPAIKIAFQKQADTPDGVPSILPSRQLRLVDSLVLAYLRQSLLAADGQSVFVSIHDIRDHVLALHTTERVTEYTIRRSTDTAVNNMSDLHVLQRTKGDPDRYLVLPVTEHLVTLEQMNRMFTAMAALTADRSAAADLDDEDETDA